MANNISLYRYAAAQSQKWHCFYCGLPMGGRGSPYAEVFPKKPLSVTAEHLQARRDGGKDCKTNIAAAHSICNWRRHQRKMPMTPLKFADYVRLRIEKNRWFGSEDLKQLIGARHRPKGRHG